METYVIHVTKLCNCDCLYCYENDKTSEYTWEEIKNFINNLINLRTSNNFGVEFLGGEPLMVFKLIKQSYEYLENKKEIEILNYTITTNGTILNNEIIYFLKKNKKINIAISMDGHKFSNQLRYFKDTYQNTYETVIKNINLLIKENINFNIHIVTHPYNIAFLSDSIDHLYKLGVKRIDIGTIEKTIKIDKEYCSRFIKELDNVSKKIINKEYSDLSIGLFNWIKPKEDIRTYMYNNNKLIGESYGRSGNDITIKGNYKTQRCTEQNEISEMIYYIRKTVYENHQKNLRKRSEIQ